MEADRSKYQNILDGIQFLQSEMRLATDCFDALDFETVTEVREQIETELSEIENALSVRKHVENVELASMKRRLTRRADVIEQVDDKYKIFEEVPKLCMYFAKRQAKLQKILEKTTDTLSPILNGDTPTHK